MRGERAGVRQRQEEEKGGVAAGFLNVRLHLTLPNHPPTTTHLRDPQSTECSRMCGMPVESPTGVRKTAPNVLFSSALTADMSSAPVFLWRYRATCESYSRTYCSRTSSKPCASFGARYSDGLILAGEVGACTAAAAERADAALRSGDAMAATGLMPRGEVRRTAAAGEAGRAASSGAAARGRRGEAGGVPVAAAAAAAVAEGARAAFEATCWVLFSVVLREGA